MQIYFALTLYQYSQFNKIELGIKYGTEVTLNLSSNVIGHSNDKNNSPHKLLLTDTLIFHINYY